MNDVTDISDISDEIKENFFSLVIKAESGCWDWTGSTNEDGPVVRISGKMLSARKISLVMENIPYTGSEVCVRGNRNCVNPDHLNTSRRDKE